MKLLVLGLAILPLVALAIFTAWLKLTGRYDRMLANFQRDIARDNSPYSLRPSLFTQGELKFLNALRQLDYEDTDLFGKVRLADLFVVRAGLRGAEFGRAFGFIAQKHIDFLYVRRSDTKPILAIELDDSTHNRPDRIKRDAFVDGIFAKADIPLVRIKAAAAYSPMRINDALQAALERKIVPEAPNGDAGWRLH